MEATPPGGGNAATQTEDGISHGTKREMNDVENRKIKHLIVYVCVWVRHAFITLIGSV